MGVYHVERHQWPKIFSDDVALLHYNKLLQHCLIYLLIITCFFFFESNLLHVVMKENLRLEGKPAVFLLSLAVKIIT